jgi:hypothetical protein
MTTVRTDEGSFGSLNINGMQGERHNSRHNRATIFLIGAFAYVQYAGFRKNPAALFYRSHRVAWLPSRFPNGRCGLAPFSSQHEVREY